MRKCFTTIFIAVDERIFLLLVLIPHPESGFIPRHKKQNTADY
jgi:hypothetical protein